MEYTFKNYAVITVTNHDFPFTIENKNCAFNDYEKAEAKFKEIITTDRRVLVVDNEDSVLVMSFEQWLKNSLLNFGENYFTATDDDGNFISVTIEEVETTLNIEAIRNVNNAYEEDCYQSDLCEKIDENLENGKYTPEQAEYMKDNIEPSYFNHLLNKNDAYFEAYWCSVDCYLDEVADGYEPKYHYFVSGIGYDKDDCVTDYDREFGAFDDCEEATEKFDEVVREAEEFLDEFFLEDEPEVAYWKVQLEKCKITEEAITCIAVLAEEDIYKD